MANHAKRQRTLTEHGRHDGLADVGADVAAAYRSTMFDERSSAAVREIREDGPSVVGRLLWLGARFTIRPALANGSRLANVPGPWGLVDVAPRAVTPMPGSVRATIRSPYCIARLVRAAVVLPAEGSRHVVLYMQGGDFLTSGANTHDRLVTTLSKYADAPVLLMNHHVFQITAPMVPEANRSLRQIGNYIREATDPYRRVAVRTTRGRVPGSRRAVISDFVSHRLPPSTIHRRTGDCR